MSNVIPFRCADGSAVFKCTGCGVSVLAAIDDGIPQCAVCRFIEAEGIEGKFRDHLLKICGNAELVRQDNENGCGNG
jgi:hypothetical protein